MDAQQLRSADGIFIQGFSTKVNEAAAWNETVNEAPPPLAAADAPPPPPPPARVAVTYPPGGWAEYVEPDARATDCTPQPTSRVAPMHAAEVLAPVEEVYVPAAQLVQLAAPVVRLLYAPHAHAVHTAGVAPAASLPYCPAAHAVHAADVGEPVTLA